MRPLTFSIYSVRDIKHFFTVYKASIRKRWGQNFLIDPNTTRKLAEIIAEKYKSRSNTLLEVGPGLGGLSQELVKSGFAIYAVEIDPALIAFLKEHSFFAAPTAAKNEFWLLRQDILTVLRGLSLGTRFSFEKIAKQTQKSKDSKKDEQNERCSELYQENGRIYANGQALSFICGNLPYAITSDFFLYLMRLGNIAGGIFLIQKEYAANILSNDKLSSIGAFLRNYGQWHKLMDVGPKCFYPQPKVHSTLVEYQAYPSGPQCSPELLEKLLRMSFRGKRKKLQTNWKKHIAEYFPKLGLQQLARWAQECQINTENRAENISCDSFYCLSKKIES